MLRYGHNLSFAASDWGRGALEDVGSQPGGVPEDLEQEADNVAVVVLRFEKDHRIISVERSFGTTTLTR